MLREGRLQRELSALLVNVFALSDVHFSRTKHAGAVQLMVTKALQIRHLIGEAMVSSDYEIITARSKSSSI